MGKHILIVDDDLLLGRSVSFSLQQAGYSTTISGSAEDALSVLSLHPPDVVLLDITLPEMDGLEALHEIKKRCNAPVLFVTAHRRELDEIIGLEAGADDYITKPFDFDVLLAHIKAVMRRSAGSSPVSSAIQVGDIYIDPTAHVVTVAGNVVELSPKEFDLLIILAQTPNRVISTETLLSRIWGADWIGETQTIYVHIRWLREKIEDDPNHPQRIITIKGIGYKLVPINHV